MLRHGPKSPTQGRAPLAVEIYYYGLTEPTTIPLHGAAPAAAEAYFRRLKADVIDAQRHSQRRLRIKPFRRTQGAQSVIPLEIQRIILVDGRVANQGTPED